MAKNQKIRQVNRVGVKDDGHTVMIYNRGRQVIPLQVKPPGGDFFLHEQTIHLHPGKHVRLPKSYTNANQIRNLQAKRQIQLIGDTEEQAEREILAAQVAQEAEDAQ